MAFYLSSEECSVAAAGVTSVLVLGGLGRAGRAIHIRCRAGTLPMTGVAAMCSVHEEVPTEEQGEQGVIADGAQRDVEDEDRRQRDSQARAQNPDHGRNTHGTISYGVIVFHVSLLGSEVLLQG